MMDDFCARFEIHGHTTIAFMKAQPGYPAARLGSLTAAKQVVSRCVKQEKLDAFRHTYINSTLIPVSSQNQLPAALALALDMPILHSLRVQSGTRKLMNAMERMLRPPVYSGTIIPGRRYLLLDDVMTTGGTLNALREFVQSRGGIPVAAMVLAFAHGSQTLTPKEETVRQLSGKFGDALTELLRHMGLPPDLHRLTNAQIKYLLRFSSVNQIYNRIASCQNAANAPCQNAALG